MVAMQRPASTGVGGRRRRRPYVDPLGRADRYAGVLRGLPPGKVDLQQKRLTVAAEGRLRVVYVPFDLIRPQARLVLVGLTPGGHQARVALAAARDGYAAGRSTLAVQHEAKRAAAFAGSMRTNLVGMLDAVGIAKALAVPSAACLFGEADRLVHPTSALRYCVLRDGRNYSGHPSPVTIPLLREFLTGLLAPELAAVPDALIIPFGDAAGRCLDWLARQGALDPTRILGGFPHPSGANGYRAARFAAERGRLTRQVRRWAAAIAET